jgi:serine/threonine protein phosphatase PrpC
MIANGTTIISGWATDKGCVRDDNEDAFLVAPQLGLWAVADGMGGHENGQLASQSVVAALNKISPAASAVELRESCEEAVVAANAQLQSISAGKGNIIGSTLVLLLIFENYYACLWSGDSRLYLIRDGAISPLTRDHTEVEELMAQGVLTADEAKRWPNRHVITRAIGVSPKPELDMISGDLRLGDTFILCSDGLTSHVSAAEVEEIANSTVPQIACDRLMRKTLERGGTDNVTIVIARHEAKETTVVLPARHVHFGTKPDGG